MSTSQSTSNSELAPHMMIGLKHIAYWMDITEPEVILAIRDETLFNFLRIIIKCNIRHEPYLLKKCSHVIFQSKLKCFSWRNPCMLSATPTVAYVHCTHQVCSQLRRHRIWSKGITLKHKNILNWLTQLILPTH